MRAWPAAATGLYTALLLLQVGEKLGKYEVEKRQAVEGEDYERAQLRKLHMDEFRLHEYREIGVHNLLAAVRTPPPTPSRSRYHPQPPCCVRRSPSNPLVPVPSFPSLQSILNPSTPSSPNPPLVIVKPLVALVSPPPSPVSHPPHPVSHTHQLC